VKDVKHGQIVFAIVEMPETVEEFLGVVEEVGEHDDERAAANLVGERVERFDETGLTGGFLFAERVEDVPEVRGIAAGRDVEGNVLLTTREPNRVALEHREVGEGTGEATGVVEFVAEFHRAAAIENEMTTEIGVGLEFFEVEPVGPGDDAPVKMPGIVADDILPVFGEFNARAAVRALMATGDAAFHRRARTEFKPGEPRESGRVEKVALDWRRHVRLGRCCRWFL
jgi:hypothetical protein